jgi:hypothetical protein
MTQPVLPDIQRREQEYFQSLAVCQIDALVRQAYDSILLQYRASDPVCRRDIQRRRIQLATPRSLTDLLQRARQECEELGVPYSDYNAALNQVRSFYQEVLSIPVNIEDNQLLKLSSRYGETMTPLIEYSLSLLGRYRNRHKTAVEAANEQISDGSISTKLVRKKKSTTNGDARLKLIGFLRAHHQVDNNRVGNFEPIGCRVLARKAGCAASTASKIIQALFGNHQQYQDTMKQPKKLMQKLGLEDGEYEFGRRTQTGLKFDPSSESR